MGMGTWDGITMLDRSAGPNRQLYQLHVDLPVSYNVATQFSAGLLQPDYDVVSAILRSIYRAIHLPYLDQLSVAWTPLNGPAGTPRLGIWSLGVEERIGNGAQTWFVVLRATIDLNGVTDSQGAAYGGPDLFSALAQPKTTVSDPAAEAMQDISEWVQRQVQAGSQDYPCVAGIMGLFYLTPGT